MTVSAGGFPARNQQSVFCFSVFAAADPSVMPRVLEVFSKMGIVPDRWHSIIAGSRDEELHIDLQTCGVDRAMAERLAQSLRRIVLVDTVLTSEKPQRQSA